MLLVFGLYAGLVVGTGWVAERKGHSFVLGAVMGFFLGIFGLAIAAVMPKKKPAA